MSQFASYCKRLRLLVLLLIVIAPFTLASAQQENKYEAELLDWTIEVSGPSYVLQNVALEEYPHGRGERIYISSVESAGFAEVSFFDDTDTPEQTIEVNLRDFDASSSAFTVLESGVAEDIHYAFARFELRQGMKGYFYIEVAEDIDGNVDLAQSLYSLDSDFLEQVSLVREEVSMAGLPFLDDPVIDLAAIVKADRELLASTPEPIATPDHGNYIFESTNAELIVEGEVEFDFPLVDRGNDLMFLRSDHGYGVVGFIHQDSETADVVMDGFFIGAPVGDETPVELYLESNDARAFGVYRVTTEGETRAMVIEVVRVDEGLWKVEALAVTESAFETSLINYQSGVTLNGSAFLGDIDAIEIVTILGDGD